MVINKFEIRHEDGTFTFVTASRDDAGVLHLYAQEYADGHTGEVYNLTQGEYEALAARATS